MSTFCRNCVLHYSVCIIVVTSIFNIRKTSPCNIYPLKPHFYTVKVGFAGVYLFFLFLLKNIDCGYSLEPPLYIAWTSFRNEIASRSYFNKTYSDVHKRKMQLSVFSQPSHFQGTSIGVVHSIFRFGVDFLKINHVQTERRLCGYMPLKAPHSHVVFVVYLFFRIVLSLTFRVMVSINVLIILFVRL